MALLCCESLGLEGAEYARGYIQNWLLRGSGSNQNDTGKERLKIIREKRKLLNFVCSNSTWKDQTLTATFRQPFDVLALTNTTWQRKRPPATLPVTFVLSGGADGTRTRDLRRDRPAF